MLGFGSKKPAVNVNHVAVFDKALADATSAARKDGVSATTLMARLEASAEGIPLAGAQRAGAATKSGWQPGRHKREVVPG